MTEPGGSQHDGPNSGQRPDVAGAREGSRDVAGKTVRIGGASAFITDSPGAARQLLDGGALDYLVFDFLAEVTMAILAKSKARHPDKGFAEEFVSLVLDDILADALDRGVRIVANAGGVNLSACRDAVLELASTKGLSPRVAIVEGDDVLPWVRANEARHSPSEIREMDTGAELPETLLSANAYLGAPPIAVALSNEKGWHARRVFVGSRGLAICFQSEQPTAIGFGECQRRCPTSSEDLSSLLFLSAKT